VKNGTEQKPFIKTEEKKIERKMWKGLTMMPWVTLCISFFNFFKYRRLKGRKGRKI
jgi:hypothetical protein